MGRGQTMSWGHDDGRLCPNILTIYLRIPILTYTTLSHVTVCMEVRTVFKFVKRRNQETVVPCG